MHHFGHSPQKATQFTPDSSQYRDYLPWKRKSFPFPLFNAGLGVLIALTGNRLGFWHGITVRN